MTNTLILSIVILLGGCASTKPTADEQLIQAVEQMRESNSTEMIYKQRQSHGLLGDLIHNVLPHPK